MKLRVLLLLAVGVAARSASADLYWHAFEAKDGKLPEDSGGAQRSFGDGVLTYDSLNDIGISDLNEIVRPGQIDPNGPSERFVMEWRLKVDKVIGTYDPGIGVGSDDSWQAAFAFGEDRLYSILEGFVAVPFTPGLSHNYRFESPDMRTYNLYIDDNLVRHGQLSQRLSRSFVSWGDAVQGGASLHDWAWMRFGVVPVPEPSGLWVLSLALSLFACQRGRPFR